MEKQIKEGAFWSSVEKGIMAVLGIMQLLVVAHYVSMEDIGLMAIATIILSVGSIFIDMKLGNSLLYYQESCPDTLSSLFWLYIILGGVVLLVSSVLARPLAWVFEEPTLAVLLPWIGLLLLISAIGQLHHVLLYKAMFLRTLSIISIVSVAAKFLVTSVLAIMGFGVWSLLLGLLSGRLIYTLLVVLEGAVIFRPRAVLYLSTIKPHLHFGAYQSLESLAILCSTRADIIIVGKIWGPEILGAYDLIKKMLVKPMRFINPVITRVSTPLLAKYKLRMEELYLRQLSYVCLINFPIYFFAGVLASPIMDLLLPESYLQDSNIIIFRLFCVYFMIYAVQNPIGTLIIASGQVHRSFWYNLIIAMVLPPLIWWGTATNGSVGAITVIVLFQGSMVWVSQRTILQPAGGVQAKDLFYLIGKSLLTSLFAVLPIWWLVTSHPTISNTGKLLIGGTGFAALYLTLTLVLDKPIRRDLKKILS